MNKIAQILRDAARVLPMTSAEETPSRFICDTLTALTEGQPGVYVESLTDVNAAKNFLNELGMENGFYVFGDELDLDKGLGKLYPVNPKHQILRKWWLLFAADLAEEWGAE